MSTDSDRIGQTLGHYRILDQIGAGGMGVVYRAHDEQLDRDVALKVLPAGTLADESARKQFRKEALALAKLSHHNIATIYEFSSQDNVDFLAMELIPGNPLSDKLQAGPLPQQEILRIAAQLAEGLAAAHDQGVIHRDLKPGNLFLTPDGRLKILDFGLAKHMRPSTNPDLTLSMTVETGAVSGTLPYMPPEQLRGLPADPRSDIYAAGTVLYEMATGRRAFPQTQGPELMGAILHQAPVSARITNSHISPGLDRVVFKAMEKDPSQRYQSARELRVAIEGLVDGDPVLSRITSTGKIGIGIGAAILLAGLAIGFNLGGLRDRLFTHEDSPTAEPLPPTPPAPLRARRSVAVLGFKNLSGRPDKAWLSTAIAEMLTTELGAGEQLRTIAGENVAQMKVNLSLPEADSYGQETLTKIRASLNADEVVVGSYLPLGKDQIRLDLRLQDAAAGETLASVSAKGREDQIDDLVSRAGAELREKLGAGAITATDAASVKAVLPSNAEAARLYSQGLARLHARDTLAARDLLQKSVALEPSFALAHSALAAAWTSLGYDGKAAAEAKAAFDLSSGLGREDKLAIEARYREATRDWDNAISIYRTLSDFFPDNLEYGLRLASTQNAAGKYKDAVATLDQLRHLPPPASDDPRIDLEEARSDNSLSQWKDMLAASNRALAKAQASGERLTLAQALGNQAGAFRYLNEFDKANSAYQESERTFAAAGDRSSAANAKVGRAVTLYHHGDLAAALQLYQQSLAVFREVGAQQSIAHTLQDIAITLYDQGDLSGAQRMYEDALAIQREIANTSGVADALNSIANVLADKGDQAGARSRYEEALTIFRNSGDQFDTAMTMGNIGSLLFDQGDLPQARKMFEQALEIKRSLNNRHSEAYTLSALGDLLLYEDDFPAARQAHEQSLAIRTTLGEKSTAAEDSLALARIKLEEGHPEDALTGARKAGDDFHAQKEVEYEASAHELAARCLLQSGKLADAGAEIQQAQKLLAKSDNHAARLPVAIVDALLATASGNFPAARTKIEAALAEATKANLLYFQYDARLALGELELKSGKASTGRTRLDALAKEATTKDFRLIARKATAAAR